MSASRSIWVASLGLAFSIACAPAAAQKVKTPPLQPPAWADSTGKTVGRDAAGGILVNAGGLDVKFSITVYRDSSRTPTRGSIWDDGYQAVHFQNVDCTGTAYINPNLPFGSARPTAVLRVGSQFTGYVGAAVATEVTYMSSYRTGDGCSVGGPSTSTLAPIESTVDLNSLGVGPFYLK